MPDDDNKNKDKGHKVPIVSKMGEERLGPAISDVFTGLAGDTSSHSNTSLPGEPPKRPTYNPPGGGNSSGGSGPNPTPTPNPNPNTGGNGQGATVNITNIAQGGQGGSSKIEGSGNPQNTFNPTFNPQNSNTAQGGAGGQGGDSNSKSYVKEDEDTENILEAINAIRRELLNKDKEDKNGGGSYIKIDSTNNQNNNGGPSSMNGIQELIAYIKNENNINAKEAVDAYFKGLKKEDAKKAKSYLSALEIAGYLTHPINALKNPNGQKIILPNTYVEGKDKVYEKSVDKITNSIYSGDNKTIIGALNKVNKDYRKWLKDNYKKDDEKKFDYKKHDTADNFMKFMKENGGGKKLLAKYSLNN